MKQKATELSLIFALLLNGSLIQAKDTLTYKFPRISIIANRYEKDSFETHLQVNLLEASQSWQEGKTSLGDWIESIPGVSQTQAGPWSQKPVIRGLSGAHVLMLIDGMKLDVLRDYGDHAPVIDVNQIDRIEIIRGPGSVLYGSNAVAGVVNIITKSPELNNYKYALKSQIGIQYASVNKQIAETIGLSGNYGKTEMLINLSHRQAEDINTPSGKLKNTTFSGYTADAKIGLHPGKDHHIVIIGHLTKMNDVGVPINPKAKTAQFKTYNRDRLALQYKWNKTEGFLSHLYADLYFQQGEREFDALLYHIPKGELFVNNRLNAHRDVKTYGASLQTGWKFTENNLLIFGTDLFAETDNTRRIADAEVVNADDQIMMNPPADLTPPTPVSNRNGLAVFLEEEWNATAWMTMNAGLRYDVISSQADGTAGTLTEVDRTETDRDFSGSIGAIFRLSPNLRFTANAGRAFKAPTLQERFFMGTAQVGYLYGNPELNSETSLNLDMGIRWQSEHLKTNLNLFDNQIDDFIVMKPAVVTADTFIYNNVGHARLSGIEWDAEFNFSELWTINANAAYVQGNDTELNENLPKIPPFNATLGIQFGKRSRGLWLKLSSQFVSTQNKVTVNESETEGYALLHLSSGLGINRLLGVDTPIVLTLNITNLMDTAYRDHLSSVTWWDAPGRNINIGIHGNF